MKNPGPSLMAFFRNPVAAYALNSEIAIGGTFVSGRLLNKSSFTS